MKIEETLTDESVLEELGARLRETRLSRNLSQDRLATEAGVSAPTIAKLETGKPVQLITLIRALRALGLLRNLEVAIPEPGPSPLEQLRHSKGRRRRASSGGGGAHPSPNKPWRWGDER